jgi:acyl-CoA synthetase (AMP-forming)/AMP-acid ligase II
MNIVDPVWLHARLSPDAPAVFAPEPNRDPITYDQLRRLANSVSAIAIAFGLPPRSVVGLLVVDPALHLAITLGLLQVGIAAVALRSASVPSTFKVTAVISDRAQSVVDAPRTIVIDETWFKGAGTAPPADPNRRVSPDDLCRIVLTSGSTGAPRAVGFTHHSLALRVASFDYVYGHRLPRSRRLYCDLGLGSSLAFMHVMHALMRGGMVLLNGSDRMGTLQALNLYGIDHMVTSPHGLGELVKSYEAGLGVLHSQMNLIMVAGGELRAELVMRTCAALGPNILNAYGATEVSRIATGDARAMLNTLGGMGYVLPGADLEVVDDADRPLPKGQEGILRMRRPEMVDGYIGDPVATAEFLRNGWFYPGDLGRLTEDGLLVVSGRIGTRLNVGGEKINPEVVEAALVSCPGVADAAVFTLPNALGIDEVHALVVADRFDERLLREHCMQTVPRVFAPGRFTRVLAIPRNEMGKIDRPKLSMLGQAHPI